MILLTACGKTLLNLLGDELLMRGAALADDILVAEVGDFDAEERSEIFRAVGATLNVLNALVGVTGISLSKDCLCDNISSQY